MHTGIFISYTSAHYQPAQALVYWRKLVLKIIPLLERTDTQQVSYLINLLFCSILSYMVYK